MKKLFFICAILLVTLSPMAAQPVSAQLEVRAQQLEAYLLGAALVTVPDAEDYRGGETHVSLCDEKRQFHYYQETGVDEPIQIRGSWSIVVNKEKLYLRYTTLKGQTGGFPIVVLANGNVKLGGIELKIRKGQAGC